jgi:hypothetical protein
MKKALINSLEPGRICDVVEPGQEFEVAPSFSWIDCPDNTTSQTRYNPDTGEFTEYNIVKDPVFIANGYMVARGIAYSSPGNQLDMLYRELRDTGTISTSGAWFQHIETVKSNIPKDDPQAVHDWNIAYIATMTQTTSITTSTVG